VTSEVKRQITWIFEKPFDRKQFSKQIFWWVLQILKKIP